jgi:hypothetical protein
VNLAWLSGMDIYILYPVTVVLIEASAELGNWIGLRFHTAKAENADVGTLATATLGLLALLVAFSISMAESRYDERRNIVLQEANAIGSTANFALMLPEPAQQPILRLLRDYAAIRIELGVPYDPAKLQQDIARSLDIQSRLWQQAVTVTAGNPQSLPAYRFVASLNEMNNIHESRLTTLRNTVPLAVHCMLVGTAMVAMGFTGFNAGTFGTRRRPTTMLMSLMIAMLIMLVVDLDRPERGLIQVSDQALVDAAAGIPRQ